jgi:predicted nucleic acid-binding protein
MILVDTSVLIKFFKGDADPKVELLKEILARDVPFGISAYTYQEILQGARDEAEFQTLREYLSTQTIYFLAQEADTYEKAAMLYFNLRRKGVTPRSTLDILIALTAMENNLALLHHDRDFDIMADYIKELRTLQKL